MSDSIRVERLITGPVDEKLEANLHKQASNFGAEVVTVTRSGDGCGVGATFKVGTREEAEPLLDALLTAAGFPAEPGTSTGATKITDVDE